MGLKVESAPVSIAYEPMGRSTMSSKVYVLNAKNKRHLMGEIWDLVGASIAKYGEIQLSLSQIIKSRLQEAKYHALISDIAKTVKTSDKQYSAKVWKAKLVVDFESQLEQLKEPLRKKGEWTMSLYNQFPIYLRVSTTEFNKQEAVKFIEYLYATGLDLGATFSEKSMAIYEEYQQIVQGQITHD